MGRRPRRVLGGQRRPRAPCSEVREFDYVEIASRLPRDVREGVRASFVAVQLLVILLVLAFSCGGAAQVQLVRLGGLHHPTLRNRSPTDERLVSERAISRARRFMLRARARLGNDPREQTHDARTAKRARSSASDLGSSLGGSPTSALASGSDSAAAAASGSLVGSSAFARELRPALQPQHPLHPSYPRAPRSERSLVALRSTGAAAGSSAVALVPPGTSFSSIQRERT